VFIRVERRQLSRDKLPVATVKQNPFRKKPGIVVVVVVVVVVVAAIIFLVNESGPIIG